MGVRNGFRRSGQVILLAICLADSGSAVSGQEIAFDPTPTVSCLAEAFQDSEAALNCVGAAANACSGTPDGSTTYGMVMCFRAEKQWWELRLAEAYASLMTQHRAYDSENARYGSRAASAADSLATMQQAWIAWRDAYCDYERATWGGGSVSGPMSAYCRLMLTGRQALTLESKLRQ